MMKKNARPLLIIFLVTQTVAIDLSVPKQFDFFYFVQQLLMLVALMTRSGQDHTATQGEVVDLLLPENREASRRFQHPRALA
ncbi:hypothetical protein R6Q59_002819 [Mikania micrantha]